MEFMTTTTDKKQDVGSIVVGDIVSISANDIHVHVPSGIRYVYEGFVLEHDTSPRIIPATEDKTNEDSPHPLKRKRSPETHVFSITTMDSTGVVQITCWRDLAEVAHRLLMERGNEGGPTVLRVEMFKISKLKETSYSGPNITSMNCIHTIQSKSSSRGSEDVLTLASGTRLSIPSKRSSRWLQSATMSIPSTPVVLSNFKEFRNKKVPFRVSVVGIISNVSPPLSSQTGNLLQAFRLIDTSGNYISCVAHGDRATSQYIKAMFQVAIFFALGRPAVGEHSTALWIFNDGFIIPISKQIVHTPEKEEIVLLEK